MAPAKGMDYKQLKGWLKETHQFFPMEDYRFALISGLEEAILYQKKEEGISDEKNYRLQWFGDYTCYQLELLATENPHWFEEEAFIQTFINRAQQRLETFDGPEIDSDAWKTYQEDDMGLFLARHRPLFADTEDTFEGLPVEDAIFVLGKATTLKMLKDLALLHEVTMPRRIHKDELVDIIARRLSLSEEEKAALADQPVLKIEGYANQHKVNAHIELKKYDMIEYIIEKWSEQAYRIPSVGTLQERSLADSIEPTLDVDTRFAEIYRGYRRRKRRRRRLVLVSMLVLLLVLGYVAVDYLDVYPVPFPLF